VFGGAVICASWRVFAERRIVLLSILWSARLRVPLQAPEVQQDARLIADDPSVVPGRHVKGLAGAELALSAVIHLQRHAALEDIPDVVNLARVGTSDWLDIL
jgi:hypothetical protein